MSTPETTPTRSDAHLIPKRVHKYETEFPIPAQDVKRLMTMYVGIVAARARVPEKSTAHNMGKAFIRYFTGRNLTICRQSLVEYAAAMDTQYKKEYSKNLVRFASGFCKWLFSQNLLDAEIWIGISIRSPVVTKKAPEIDYPTTMRLLRHRDPELGFMFCLAYHTGMSVVDCCHLRWSSVDLDAGFLRITRQKTGTPATIPIRKFTDLMFELSGRADEHADRGGSPDDFVSPVAAEKYRERYNVIRWLPRTLHYVGLPHLNWHDLRRAFCSRLMGARVNLLVASKITGHSKIDVLRRYSTVPEPALEEAIAMMNDEPTTEAPVNVP